MDTASTPHWFTTINSIVTFGSSLIVLIVGGIGGLLVFRTLLKGGTGFIRASKKISKFVDRVDVVIDDFWPEILGGLERQGLVNFGASAKWTSAQAKILKSKSPIEITDDGNKIINEIGFEKIYSDNSTYVQKLLKDKLGGNSSVTEFDIEQAALKLVSELFEKGDSLIKSAENYSFNHPKMSISQLSSLLGIFVRDKIIKDPDMRQKFGLATLV